MIKDRDRKIVEQHPLFESEIREVVLKSGNCVSTGALASMGFWNIDCIIMTKKGRPVAMLRSFDDDSHVKTRICQYEAYKKNKAIGIMKAIVKAKIEGQNQILRKHGLKNHPFANDQYFNQIFQLLPFRPENKKGFKAFDGINNIFNLAYEVLSWKIFHALPRAKLEPYLGFLHSVQFGKPSLVCDFQELYRYLIDDFLIQYCQNLRKKDFMLKTESFSRDKMAKREYLNDAQTRDLTKQLNRYFESNVEVPRIRVGKRQTIETLINEEALLFARFLRGEREIWIPRIATPLLTYYICAHQVELKKRDQYRK